MRVFIGVDGGGTSTRVLALREDFLFSQLATGPASNPLAIGFEQAAESVISTISKSLSEAGHVESMAIFAGLAGLRTGLERQQFSQELEPRLKALNIQDVSLHLGSDLEAAHAGAFNGESGVIVVAGTGSAALARNADGIKSQAGGWGWRIDDAGSGYWVGCQGLRAAARANDGRGPPTLLTVLLPARLDVDLFDEIRAKVHSPQFTREQTASLAESVLEAAQGGDEPAADIVQKAARELALLGKAAANSARLGSKWEVCLVGGLGKSVYFHEHFRMMLQQAHPEACLTSPVFPPVVGSAILAAKSKGVILRTSTLTMTSHKIGNVP